MDDTLLLGVRVVVSLAIVLALLWYLARRLGAGSSTVRRVPVTVLGRQTLSRRAGVTVVEVEGRTLLLGVSDNGVSLLTELDAPPVLPLEGEADGAGEVPPRTRAEVRARQATEAAARPGGALAGSVLAPSTWRSTWDAARGRGRR